MARPASQHTRACGHESLAFSIGLRRLMRLLGNDFQQTLLQVEQSYQAVAKHVRHGTCGHGKRYHFLHSIHYQLRLVAGRVQQDLSLGVDVLDTLVSDCGDCVPWPEKGLAQVLPQHSDHQCILLGGEICKIFWAATKLSIP